jgi:hypothetical protein
LFYKSSYREKILRRKSKDETRYDDKNSEWKKSGGIVLSALFFRFKDVFFGEILENIQGYFLGVININARGRAKSSFFRFGEWTIV